MKFSDNLKIARIKAGYKTAKSLSRALGIPYTRYINYESKNIEPDFKMLVKIADILNCSIDTLLKGNENHSDNLEGNISQFMNAGFNVKFLKDKNIVIVIDPDSIPFNTAYAFSVPDFMALAQKLTDSKAIKNSTCEIYANALARLSANNRQTMLLKMSEDKDLLSQIAKMDSNASATLAIDIEQAKRRD